MVIKNIEVNQNLRDYLLKFGGVDTPELAALRDLAASHPQTEMQATAEQGQIMFFLAKLINAKNALELGVFLGYSTLAMALALPDDGKIIACDTDRTNPEQAIPFWEKAGVLNKIDLRITPALELLESLAAAGTAKFDLVFVDADKGNYEKYYDLIVPMLNPGGLLALDNTLWLGEVADYSINNGQVENFRELNKKISEDKRVFHSILPFADGITLITRA